MNDDIFYLNTLSTVSEETPEAEDAPQSRDLSQLRQTSITSLEESEASCRICHSSGCSQETGELLVSPCKCRGSLGHVHQNCLDSWLKRRGLTSCELCQFRFRSERRIKPVREWRLDDMRERLTGEEKAILLLGIINFLLLFVEFPFLYFIVRMNNAYFRSSTVTAEAPSNWIPFLLLMLLVFVLIFITTSLIFIFCGVKICRKILNLNTEMVLFIPAVSYGVGNHEV